MSKQKDYLNKELLRACKYDDNITTIQNLIKQGADVNSHNTLGMTALHFACQNDNLEIVKMLLENSGTSSPSFFRLIQNLQPNSVYKQQKDSC